VVGFGLLATGCSTVDVNQPYDTDMINFRSTLMLDATPQPPLTEERSKEVVAALEQRMLHSPYVGRTISRAEFHQQFDSNFALRDDYTILSDTLSTVGLSDREQTARLGKAVNVEFLLGVQAFSVPCDTCLEGDQVSVLGQMFDARTGLLVWRVTLLQQVQRTQAGVDAGLNELQDELVQTFISSLRPKWHRQRFANLRHGAAKLQRPVIQLPAEVHTGISGGRSEGPAGPARGAPGSY
jgi:hypothetical protein